jgi:hypothetical protein
MTKTVEVPSFDALLAAEASYSIRIGDAPNGFRSLDISVRRLHGVIEVTTSGFWTSHTFSVPVEQERLHRHGDSRDFTHHKMSASIRAVRAFCEVMEAEMHAENERRKVAT